MEKRVETRGYADISQNGAPPVQNPIHGIESPPLAPTTTSAGQATSRRAKMNPIHGIESIT